MVVVFWFFLLVICVCFLNFCIDVWVWCLRYSDKEVMVVFVFRVVVVLGVLCSRNLVVGSGVRGCVGCEIVFI